MGNNRIGIEETQPSNESGDLVDKLRAPTSFGGQNSEDAYERYDSLRLEAADEIERLRERLDAACRLLRQALPMHYRGLTIDREILDFLAEVRQASAESVR